MTFPPIDHADLVAIGMPADAALGCVDGSLVCDGSVPHIVIGLLSAAMLSPPPGRDRLAYVRHVRGLLLGITDWTQVSDAPLPSAQKAAWATYRQALRDLPSAFAEGNPVAWPTPPGTE